jgi:hypothetical protein
LIFAAKERKEHRDFLPFASFVFFCGLFSAGCGVGLLSGRSGVPTERRVLDLVCGGLPSCASAALSASGALPEKPFLQPVS